MSDWAGQFKTFNDSVGNAAKSVYNMIDQWSFKAVIDCLKSDDYDVVAEGIDQLVKENRPLSIAPLYFVSQAHPNTFARKKAQAAIKELGKEEEVEEVTRGKSLEDGTRALIQKYGNTK